MNKKIIYENVLVCTIGNKAIRPTYRNADEALKAFDGGNAIYGKIGEWGSPNIEGMENPAQRFDRVISISQNLASHVITAARVEQDPEDEGTYRVYADIVPYGPYGKHLIAAMDDPDCTVVFAARALNKVHGVDGPTILTVDVVSATKNMAKPPKEDPRPPIDELDEENVTALCKLIDGFLPEGYHFTLFMAPFGDGTHGDRLRYASNANREQVLNMLKEWMLKCGAEEDWMKHIK